MKIYPALFFVLLLFNVSCSYADTEKLVIASSQKKEKAVFHVEIADTDSERAQGLMGRTSLEPDHGMLFVFKGEDMRHFWMKDTPISLDIIFMNANGDIVSIAQDATPNSRKPISSILPAQFALEIPGGEAEKQGLRVGDHAISKTISNSVP